MGNKKIKSTKKSERSGSLQAKSKKKGKSKQNPENVVKYSIYGLGGLVGICVLLIIVFLVIPNTVATAGDVRITEDEFIFFHTQAVNSYMQYNTERMPPEEFLNQDLGGTTFRQMAITSALQQVHEYAVQYALAKENNLSLTQEETNRLTTSLKAYLDDAAREHNVSINVIARANFGMNFSRAVKIYEKMTLGDKYRDHAISNMSIPEEDYKEYYEENREYFERVKARHILLLVEETDSTMRIEAIEDQAYELLQRVLDGEDFDTLAFNYSEDTGSSEQGGEYTFYRGQMVPEFEAFVFDNEPGTVDVVRSEYGFHVVEVLEHMTEYEDNREIVQRVMPEDRYESHLKEVKSSEYQIELRPAFNRMF